MMYELWDSRTRNLIGAYRSRDEALADVRAEIEEYGRDSAEQLFLGCHDGHGRIKLVAAGAELVELALASKSAMPSCPKSQGAGSAVAS